MAPPDFADAGDVAGSANEARVGKEDEGELGEGAPQDGEGGDDQAVPRANGKAPTPAGATAAEAPAEPGPEHGHGPCSHMLMRGAFGLGLQQGRSQSASSLLEAQVVPRSVASPSASPLVLDTGARELALVDPVPIICPATSLTFPGRLSVVGRAGSFTGSLGGLGSASTPCSPSSNGSLGRKAGVYTLAEVVAHTRSPSPSFGGHGAWTAATGGQIVCDPVTGEVRVIVASTSSSSSSPPSTSPTLSQRFATERYVVANEKRPPSRILRTNASLDSIHEEA